MIITRPVCKITIFSKFSIFVCIWIGIHNSPLCSLYFQENLLQSYLNREEGAMSCSVNGGGESGLELVNKRFGRNVCHWWPVFRCRQVAQCLSVCCVQPVFSRAASQAGTFGGKPECGPRESHYRQRPAWLTQKNNHRNSNLRSIQLFPQSALSLKQSNVDLMQDYLMTFF